MESFSLLISATSNKIKEKILLFFFNFSTSEQVDFHHTAGKALSSGWTNEISRSQAGTKSDPLLYFRGQGPNSPTQIPPARFGSWVYDLLAVL